MHESYTIALRSMKFSHAKRTAWAVVAVYEVNEDEATRWEAAPAVVYFRDVRWS